MIMAQRWLWCDHIAGNIYVYTIGCFIYILSVVFVLLVVLFYSTVLYCNLSATKNISANSEGIILKGLHSSRC